MSPNDLACELFFREIRLEDSDKKVRRVALRACTVADLFYEELAKYAKAKPHPQPPQAPPPEPEEHSH